MIWLESLRTATRDAHDALHHHPLLAPLSQEGLTRAHLGAILQAFELYYRASEAAISVSPPTESPNAPVRDWLTQDMATFSITPVKASLTVEPIDTSSRLIGYLYTKQGSTLGGRVISKHIEGQLGLRPLMDQHFFAGYGPDNGPQWKAFVEQVTARETELDLVQMVTAAIDAFDGIGRACDHVVTMRLEPTYAFH